MEQVVTFITSQGTCLESTLLVSSIVTLVSVFMIKRSKKSNMDDSAAHVFTRKIYYIAFRERNSNSTDVSRPFDFPVVASYVGFEGDDGLSFLGLLASTDGTHFHITTKSLNDKKANKSSSEIKASALSAFANDKKTEGVLSDLEPKSFSEILADFIDCRHVEVYPEAKKKLMAKWKECSNTSSIKSPASSDSNEEENEEKDLFESQSMETDANKEDSTESIMKEIEQLSSMDSWQLGHAEHDMVDRLIKMSKKFEKNLKDLTQAEHMVNEEFANLVSYKVAKTIGETERAHKVTQDALKTANKKISKELSTTNQGIKTIFKYQQEKFANITTKQKELAETLNSTNLKLH